MNILASYNWIKEYLKTDLSSEDFAREMSLKSMSVESIDHLPGKFENIVIGVVSEMKTHPNADKLKIAITDIGSKKVQIVCGGLNLAEGMRVVVALPGSKVRWHGEGELVELVETKIRGEESFGMICAAEELGFAKYPAVDHGIWDFGEISEAEAGTSFVEAFGLDDVIFDIEVTSNRVDAMSMVGLAREGAAVTGDKFMAPDIETIKEIKNEKKPLTVSVKDSEACPRYMAVVVNNVKVEASPAWLQRKLLLAGHRPINNIVDITNYILHEYGQPLHAFDYDELAGGEIVVRAAKDGEKFLALDDKEYELKKSNLVIADAEKPVAVAGVMGGRNSGTKANTRTVVFEAAIFDSINIRKTSRLLNLYSDSQLLFEKGLSVKAPELALAKAVELALEIAGGEVASEVYDIQAAEYIAPVFSMRTDRIRKLLGIEIQNTEILDILSTLGFEAEGSGDNYKVTVPYWRDHDIEHEIDLTEEVARIYGYHNLPSKIPTGAPPTGLEDKALVWESNAKRYFCSAGYTELYGYSFVSASMLEKYGLNPHEAVVLHNPLTSDLTHMRTSLMPSLLSDIAKNQGQVHSAKIFDLSPIYITRKNDLPLELAQLVVAEYGQEDVPHSFLRLKGVLTGFAKKAGLNISLERLTDDEKWHPSRSASIMVDGEQVGVIGQVADKYQQAFGINKSVVAIDFSFAKVVLKMKKIRRYEPIPEFPATDRDLAVVVDVEVEFLELEKTIKEQSSIVESVNLIDIYRGAGIPEGKKSVTLSITLRAPDKTLSSDHVADVMKAVEKVLKKQFDASIR